MSYCRWSSMNWRCDIYAYESVGDFWSVNVAGSRRIGVWPDDLDKEFFLEKSVTAEEWVKRHNDIMAIVGKCEFEPINLPYAGESLSEPTLEAFKARMLELRALGYLFPDRVIDSIDQEIRERDDLPTHET